MEAVPSVRNINTNKNKLVLDVGFGFGGAYVNNDLDQDILRIGLDKDPRSASAGNKYGIPVILTDISEIEFSEEIFERIEMYFPSDELLLLITKVGFKLHQALKNDGVFTIWWEQIIDGRPQAINRNPKAIINYLNLCGFYKVNWEPVDPGIVYDLQTNTTDGFSMYYGPINFYRAIAIK